MADEPESLVLVLLRQMDQKLDRVIDDLHDVKVRLTAVEEGLNVVQRRIDRLEVRVERIEKRLDLVDTH
jgi:cob(I)alamin adenosyltransferase